MDEFVKNILSSWNLSSLIHKFEDEEIEKQSFDVLTETMIRELIPKMGKRALFLHKYQDYKKVAEASAHQPDENINSMDEQTLATVIPPIPDIKPEMDIPPVHQTEPIFQSYKINEISCDNNIKTEEEVLIDDVTENLIDTTMDMQTEEQSDIEIDEHENNFCEVSSKTGEHLGLSPHLKTWPKATSTKQSSEGHSGSSTDSTSSNNASSDSDAIQTLDIAKRKLKIRRRALYNLLKENRKLRKFKDKQIFKGVKSNVQANGDEVFPCGVTLTAQQSSFLRLIPKNAERDSKFLNCVLDTVFGADVLAASSLTGTSTKSANVMKLDSEKLEVVKALFLSRLKGQVDSFDRAERFNNFVRRRIQNLKKEDKRKSKKHAKSESDLCDDDNL